MKQKNEFSLSALILPALVLAAFVGAVVFLSQKAIQEMPVATTTMAPSLDPSYLTIYTNLEVTPRIFSPYNEEIIGYSDIESPLAAEGNPIELSGESLNVFSFPKPPYGKYRVSFEGTGEYKADITVVGKDGSIFSDIFTGDITEKEPSEIFIYIGEENRVSED
jgi:hypothetical protein